MKDFLLKSRRKDARQVTIKKKKGSTIVKFKVRCSRFLYTLTCEKEKADKLRTSLPPGTLTNKIFNWLVTFLLNKLFSRILFLIFIAGLQVKEID